MPHPFPLAAVWSGGMRRDVDRGNLPGGSCWNLVDFIPDQLGAPISGRGGWTYAGNALTGATKIESLSYAPFSGGAKLLAIDQQPKLWDVVGASSIVGTPTIPGGPPAYHRGKLIIPNSDGTTAVTYYDGSTLGSLAGSPPTGQLAAVYKDHAILAKSSANTNRLWFSAAGDPTTWDTTYGWWDTTGTVIAIAPLLNCVLVFHADSTERLRGNTPPPGTDMVLEPFLDYGCIDPFSVANWLNRVIWAAPEGIYISDGATAKDLTANGQMKTYWQSLMASYSTSWRVSGGIYRDHYIVSINNGSTLVDCLCVNLMTGAMWRFSNLHGAAFVQVGTSVQEELYMGQWNAGRVAKLSPLWSPAASNKQDGDSTNPAPLMETAGFRGWDRLHRRWIESHGKQKWRFGYLDYDLRDAATDNPTITLSYGTSYSSTYTACSPTFAATTALTRGRRTFSGTVGGATHAQMLTVELAVNGPYQTAQVYTIEGVFEPIEIGAL